DRTACGARQGCRTETACGARQGCRTDAVQPGRRFEAAAKAPESLIPGGDGGWGSDKKVNSYPMTSEDDQSGRLTAAADVAEPKRPWRGCRFHPDRAWNSGPRLMRGTFRDVATAELQRLPNESGPGCFDRKGA